MRLAICGHGRSGKDTAAHWLNRHTSLHFHGSLSWYLAIDVAKKTGLSREEAYKRRHDSDDVRLMWYNLGRELRKNNPGYLINKAIEDGSDIICGVRDKEEVLWMIDNNIVDLVIWIDRDVKTDPTMEFGPELCDVMIYNNGTLEDLCLRLARLSKALNILRIGEEFNLHAKITEETAGRNA